jgi:hypothetical protein
VTLFAGYHLGTRGLNLLAHAAVRLRPPERARGLVCAVARLLPALPDLESADAAVDALGDAGTCLSRSLTVAARLPGAEVVIATTDPSAGPFGAHAWVEACGRRVGTHDADIDPERFVEIARLK